MNKILLNTIILYVKIVLTMALSFVSVPIVLRALGAEDYGLYALVAGVVAMLAFLNTSMTVSTQRYLSVTMGAGKAEKITEVFSCSVYQHVLLGLALCALFEIAGLFVFDGFLNIPQERVGAAKIIYQCLVLSTFFTIVSVPYDAALNAHENMLAFSLIMILGALLRLGLAVSLLYVHADKLIVYGAGMACASLAETCLKRMCMAKKYAEMKRLPLRQMNKSLFKEMFSFVGWNVFGSLALVLRNQGFAVVLNLFFGTIANAAYGVANQVNGVLANFSGSLQKAINPQLMKNEGANRHNQVVHLTFVSIKMSEFILGLMAVPLIIEMETILVWWLGDVPEYTITFCRLVLVMNMIVSFSSGIGLAIQAKGDIKRYTLTVGLLLLFHLPIAYMLLYLGLSPYSALLSMCLLEVVIMFARFFFGYKLAGLSIREMVFKILFPFFVIYMLAFLIGFSIKVMFEPSLLRVLLVTAIVIMIMMFVGYWLLWDEAERNQLWGLLKIKKYARQ